MKIIFFGLLLGTIFISGPVQAGTFSGDYLCINSKHTERADVQIEDVHINNLDFIKMSLSYTYKHTSKYEKNYKQSGMAQVIQNEDESFLQYFLPGTNQARLSLKGTFNKKIIFRTNSSVSLECQRK